jgi:glycosyltransferase involved in cell wall biosynthesis
MVGKSFMYCCKKVKIVYIANARIPTEKAHGIQIMKMCEAFSSNANTANKYANDTNKESIEVELWAPRRINPIKDDPFDYYGVERIFKIRKFPCLDFVIFDKYIGHLGTWIETLTFALFVLPYFLFKKADIFYTREKFCVPFVFFKKNFYFEAHTFPKNYFLYSPFLKKIKKIIVITQKLKELFVEQGIPEERILVAPDGVDIEKFDVQCSKFDAREKLGLLKDKKIVLYTGHLYKWKGANVLAESSKYLPEDTEIYFVGGTEQDIEQFKHFTSNVEPSLIPKELQGAQLPVCTSNLEPRTSNLNIIGHRPHSEIPYWLRAADVLVLPNSGKDDISKYWTSPIKMFEYMASKKPIIASDLPSIREVLNDSNAVLVDSDNPKALAEGIKKILQNPEFSAKISYCALEDVQGYSWHKRTDKIIEFLKNNL